MKQMWCIGTSANEYLVNLEDVLDVYAHTIIGIMRLYIDKRPCQLLDHRKSLRHVE